MSTPGPNLTTAVTTATEVVESAKQITTPVVSFNPILDTVTEFNPANAPSKIASGSALKSTVASAQKTVNAATTVVSGGPTLGTETATASSNVNTGSTNSTPSNNANGSTNSTPSNNANGSTNSTPSNNANGSTNSTPSNNANGSTQSNESNQSNENTEEPEIKSITIYNKTFLVETKVENPLTEEQERLALHLRLPEFKGKDDKWRHSVLREVIQGCTGDFSVTVGAQCHSFRSYLEELAQKVFDEDMPIIWEGEEEERKEAEEGRKKRKTLRKNEDKEEGEGEGKESKEKDKKKGEEEGEEKEYEITISIPLDVLRNLLTSMPVTGSEILDNSAHATVVEGSNLSKIKIMIKGKPVILSKEDCIKFIRKDEHKNDMETIAKITGFAFTNSLPTGIYFLPWRLAEKRWATEITPHRMIDLAKPLSGFGDWRTIIKQDICPDKMP